MTSEQEGKRILAIILTVTNSIEKSAHMCVLKYLARMGWNITVLTVDKSGATETFSEDWCGIKIVRVCPTGWQWRAVQSLYRARRTGRASRAGVLLGKIANRLLLPITLISSFPDRFATARGELLKHALRLHQEAAFDVVVSLYWPLCAHLVARDFEQQTRIPWMGFSKDFYAWPDELIGSASGRWINSCRRRYESGAVTGMKRLLSTSDFMTKYYEGAYAGTECATLQHCYDDDVYPTGDRSASCDESGIFRLVSVGVVTKHDEAALTDLFEVIGALYSEDRLDRERFRIRFVGHGLHVVKNRAERFGVSALLETRSTVPHTAAIQEMCQATCLFVKRHEWDSKRRLTEYIGARRPILAYPTYAGHMTNGVLEEYGASRIAANKSELKSVIDDTYQEFLVAGKLDWPMSEHIVLQQSATNRAKELDGHLMSILDNRVEANSERIRVTF